MCGISGIYLKKGTINKKVLQKNNSIMKHRGPDSEGIFISKNKQIGLSQVRLSIVDLDKRSDQPMTLKKLGLTITFNGEIYNYLEIKNELEKKYSFETNSDTEVLLIGFKEYGIKILDKIEGMFAFSIYNEQTQELFIARDFIGQKPLVYHEGKEGFYFSSEIPVILNMKPELKKDIDWTSIKIFLSDKFSHIPQPFTAYKKIKKLKPSHYMIIKKGKIIQYKQYFQLIKEKSKKIDDVKLVEDTIENMKPKEVEFASFLSGGIDSSLICAVLQKNNEQKVQAYTMTLNDKKEPDYERSKYVSSKLNLKQHTIKFKQENTLTNLKKEIKILGEPYFHITTIYTDQIMEKVKKKHKVIFTGAGGDENYYGYNNKNLLLVDLLLKIKKLVPINILKIIIPKENQIILKSNLKTIKKNLYSESYDKNKSLIIGKDEKNKYLNEINKDFFKFGKIKSFIELSYLSGLITENSHSLTIPADLIGMKHSIEVRNPFLEKKIIQRGFNLKLLEKVSIFRLHEGKEILRKSLLKIFPKKFVYAKKYGFGTEFNIDEEILKINEKEIKEKIKSLSKRKEINEKEISKIKFNKNNFGKIMKLYALELFLE